MRGIVVSCILITLVNKQTKNKKKELIFAIECECISWEIIVYLANLCKFGHPTAVLPLVVYCTAHYCTVPPNAPARLCTAPSSWPPRTVEARPRVMWSRISSVGVRRPLNSYYVNSLPAPGRTLSKCDMLVKNLGIGSF